MTAAPQTHACKPTGQRGWHWLESVVSWLRRNTYCEHTPKGAIIVKGCYYEAVCERCGHNIGKPVFAATWSKTANAQVERRAPSTFAPTPGSASEEEKL